MTKPITNTQNLGAIFGGHVSSDRTAIIDLTDEAAPREISYSILDEMCQGVARGLTTGGLIKEDRIGILGLNSVEFIAVLFGAMQAGIVPVPINIKQPAAGVAAIMEDAGVNFMF